MPSHPASPSPSSSPTDHDPVARYLAHLRSRGKVSTAYCSAKILATYVRLLTRERADATPLNVTGADLLGYRAALATSAATITPGRVLAMTTQATHLAVVRSFYGFLMRRRLVTIDAARYLELPRISRRTVAKDYLSTQEAQALMDTALAIAHRLTEGTSPWASAWRDVAMVALAVASGRRRSGLCNLMVEDLDVGRAELRVAIEKGRMGRVLPLAEWAVAIVRHYRDHARPVLLAGCDAPWLFVAPTSFLTGALKLEVPSLAPETFNRRLAVLVTATEQANPDLEGLAQKTITTHSLRVTTARLLFSNGCGIRSVCEILLHERLSTTAQYTPIPVEELRRVMIRAGAHPRA